VTDENLAWSELSTLLVPIHDDVLLFACRVAGSNAAAWMYSVVVSVQRTRSRRAF
jgi:hypothetical protein